MNALDVINVFTELIYTYSKQVCLDYIENSKAAEIDASLPMVLTAMAQQASGSTPVHYIAEENLPYLHKKIAAMNRRIVKKGAEQIYIRELYSFHCSVEEYQRNTFGRVTIDNSSKEAREESYNRTIRVTAVGCPVPEVVVGDYTLDGIIDHEWHVERELEDVVVNEVTGLSMAVYGEVDYQATKEGGCQNMVTMVGDAKSKPEYFNGYHCTHCGINRIRKHTLVIRNVETGEVQRMGTACAKDFLGNTSAEGFLHMAKIYESIKDTFDKIHSKLRPSEEEHIRNFMGACILSIETSGYVSRKKSWPENPATADRVSHILYGTFSDNNLADVSDSQHETAKKVIEFIRSDKFTGDSDYVANMKTVLSGDYIRIKDFGYAASAWSCWKRYDDKVNANANINSEWMGEIKQRLRNKVVTVKSAYLKEGYYGWTTTVTFLDEQNRKGIWYASGDHTHLEVGGVYDFTGTIKKLNDYEPKNTVFSRCILKEM